jgi:hypothetical protein
MYKPVIVIAKVVPPLTSPEPRFLTVTVCVSELLVHVAPESPLPMLVLETWHVLVAT